MGSGGGESSEAEALQSRAAHSGPLERTSLQTAKTELTSRPLLHWAFIFAAAILTSGLVVFFALLDEGLAFGISQKGFSSVQLSPEALVRADSREGRGLGGDILRGSEVSLPPRNAASSSWRVRPLPGVSQRRISSGSASLPRIDLAEVSLDLTKSSSRSRSPSPPVVGVKASAQQHFEKVDFLESQVEEELQLDLPDQLRREGWVCKAKDRESSLEISEELLRELHVNHAALVSDRVRLLLDGISPSSPRGSFARGLSPRSSSGFEAGLTPRALLTAEAYAQADRRLAEAVREDRLTKAVRVGGQYIYPWPEFSKEDREQLRLMADQLKWLPKWIRNHRNAQRVHQGALGAHLPVVRPKFADKYGGPGSTLLGAAPGVRYTWLGHASGLATVDGLKVLIDPVLSDDLVGAMQAWVKRLLNLINTRLCGSLGERLRPAPTRISELPPDLHLVILSHNHPDHIMEGDVQKLCRSYRARFRDLFWYVPEGVAWFLVRHGCPAQRVFEFTWGESRTLSCFRRKGRYACADGEWSASEGAATLETEGRVDSFSITFVGNVHWSGRSTSKTDHNTSLWGSFSIAGPKHRFYYGGDTSFFKPDFNEFKKVGKLLGPFHLAALPIGAYEPNDDLRYQHVRPSEALQIFRDIRAEVAVGVHWGTFRLSAEKFFDPLLELECALLDVPLAQCRGDSSSSSASPQTHSSGAASLVSEAGEGVHTQQSISEGTASVAAIRRRGTRRGPGGTRRGTRPGSRQQTTIATLSSIPSRRRPEEGLLSTTTRRMHSGRASSASLESSPEDSLAYASMRQDEEVVIGSTVTAAVLLEPEPDLHNEDFVAFETEHENGVRGEGAAAPDKSVSARLFSKVVTAFPPVASVGLWSSGLENLSLADAIKPTRLARGHLQLSSSWSDPFMHPSNFRRLRRAERLEELGLLSDPHWRERLLVEGTRFQTIHIGQSIQVEEGEDEEYLLMTRSSARDHIDPHAPEEQYAFLPMHIGADLKEQSHKGSRQTERHDKFGKRPLNEFPSTFSSLPVLPVSVSSQPTPVGSDGHDASRFFLKETGLLHTAPLDFASPFERHVLDMPSFGITGFFSDAGASHFNVKGSAGLEGGLPLLTNPLGQEARLYEDEEDFDILER